MYDTASTVYGTNSHIVTRPAGYVYLCQVGFWNQPGQERVAFTVVDVRTDELTLRLEGGSTWIKVCRP